MPFNSILRGSLVNCKAASYLLWRSPMYLDGPQTNPGSGQRCSSLPATLPKTWMATMTKSHLHKAVKEISPRPKHIQACRHRGLDWLRPCTGRTTRLLANVSNPTFHQAVNHNCRVLTALGFPYSCNLSAPSLPALPSLPRLF